MSMRSRISFLIGCMFVLSQLATGMLTLPTVSAQAVFQLPTATTNKVELSAGKTSYNFIPIIANDASAKKRNTPTPTLVLAGATATKPAPTVPPIQSTATLKPTSTLAPTSAPTTSPATLTYYVSMSGSDTNTGTLASPWRTIQKAANTMVAGDTVEIRGGTYNEQVLITRSGNATAGYITYTNYPGETPVIDGVGIVITPSAGLINMVNISYIKIAGLRVVNSDDAGIFVRKGHYIVVQNNSTQNTHSSGVGIWSSDNVLVDSNKVVDARYVDLAQGGHEESISIGSTTSFEVKNNDVSLQNNSGYLGNEGIDIKESSRYGKVHHNYVHDFPSQGGAIYVDAWNAGLNGTPTLSNIEIYDNVVENAGPIMIGAEIGGTAENIKIYNNLVINGPATGIGISNTGIANAPNGDGPRMNIEIYNNTIYKARWNGGAGIFVMSANIRNIVIRNNITNMNNHNGEIVVAVPSALPQVQADHNLVFGSKYCSLTFPNCVEISNLTNSTIFGNITADPKFADLSSGNLHLAVGSPAIDSGTNLAASGVAADLDGITRPRGSAYDIGAYEH